MGKFTIEELNEMIIKSRFPKDGPRVNDDVQVGKGINEEFLAKVKEHRRVFGLTSKIQLLRNYLRTRPFIKTTLFKAA